MSAEPSQPEPTDITPEQARVQRDIEEAREELGGIAEALAQKANIRARTQRRVVALKEQARARAEAARTAAIEQYRARPTYVTAGGAAVVLIIGAITGTVLRRRR